MKNGSHPAILILLGGLLVFAPLLEGGTTHQAVMVLRLVILAGLGLALGRMIQSGTLWVPRLPVNPAVGLFLGFALALTVSSPYVHQSFQWLLVLAGYAGLLYLCVWAIATWRDAGALLLVLSAVAAFEAALALYQKGWLGALRPSGTFFNPNYLAGYLAGTWTVLFGLVCYQPVRRAVMRLRWYGPPRCGQTGLLAAGLGVLVLLLSAIVWTGSRGTSLALLGGLAVVLTMRYGRRGAGVLLILLIAVLVIPNPVRDRFIDEYERNPVGYARWGIWKVSVAAMLDHPAGIGLGLYQYVFPRYMFPIEDQIMRYGRVAHQAHNEYLQMGVELGVMSLPLFAWGLAAVFMEARRTTTVRLRRWQRGLVTGLTGAVTVLLLHAGLDATLHTPAIAILLTVCVALLLSVRRISGLRQGAWHRLDIRYRGVITGLVLLVVGALAIEVVRLGAGWMLHESGSRALAASQVETAVARYEAAVAVDPGVALYHSALAATHFRRFLSTSSEDAAETALIHLQIAGSLNPLDGRLAALLGHVYVTLAGSQPDSEKDGTEAQSRRMRWLEAARAAYVRALELEPYSPFYRLELGKLHIRLGQPEQAEQIIREAVALEHNFLPGRLWLAEHARESGKPDAARREYHEILERHRRYAKAPRNSVEERFLQVDVAQVEASLKRLKVGP